jgi:hypothetical protein
MAFSVSSAEAMFSWRPATPLPEKTVIRSKLAIDAQASGLIENRNGVALRCD